MCISASVAGRRATSSTRRLSDEVLEALRLRALRGCELGYNESQVADLLGVARETVCRWWSAYADQGVDALPPERTGRPVGSGRTLTDEQASHLHLQGNHDRGAVHHLSESS